MAGLGPFGSGYLGEFNALSGSGAAYTQPSYDIFIDPSGAKNAMPQTLPTCECPACKSLKDDSANPLLAYQTNSEIRHHAYDYVKHRAREMTTSSGEIQVGAVLEMVTNFALEQLKRREQYYQRRFQDIKLEHAQQLSMFMKREKILAKKAGEEASAKHTVPDTNGRLFREGEENV